MQFAPQGAPEAYLPLTSDSHVRAVSPVPAPMESRAGSAAMSAHSALHGPVDIQTNLDMQGLSLNLNLDMQEARYATILRYLEDRPQEQLRWGPYIAQLRQCFDECHVDRQELDRSSANISGHLQELTNCMDRQQLPQFGWEEERLPESNGSMGLNGNVDLKATVLALLESSRFTAQVAAATNVGLEAARVDARRDTLLLRDEVLQLVAATETDMQEKLDTIGHALFALKELATGTLNYQLDNMADMVQPAQSGEVGSAEVIRRLEFSSMAAAGAQSEQQQQLRSDMATQVSNEKFQGEMLPTKASGERDEKEDLQPELALQPFALQEDLDALRSRIARESTLRGAMRLELEAAVSELRALAAAPGPVAARSARGVSMEARPANDLLGIRVNEVAEDLKSLHEDMSALRSRLSRETRFRGAMRTELDAVSDRQSVNSNTLANPTCEENASTNHASEIHLLGRQVGQVAEELRGRMAQLEMNFGHDDLGRLQPGVTQDVKVLHEDLEAVRSRVARETRFRGAMRMELDEVGEAAPIQQGRADTSLVGESLMRRLNEVADELGGRIAQLEATAGRAGAGAFAGAVAGAGAGADAGAGGPPKPGAMQDIQALHEDLQALKSRVARETRFRGAMRMELDAFDEATPTTSTTRAAPAQQEGAEAGIDMRLATDLLGRRLEQVAEELRDRIADVEADSAAMMIPAACNTRRTSRLEDIGGRLAELEAKIDQQRPVDARSSMKQDASKRASVAVTGTRLREVTEEFQGRIAELEAKLDQQGQAGARNGATQDTEALREDLEALRARLNREARLRGKMRQELDDTFGDLQQGAAARPEDEPPELDAAEIGGGVVKDLWRRVAELEARAAGQEGAARRGGGHDAETSEMAASLVKEMRDMVAPASCECSSIQLRLEALSRDMDTELQAAKGECAEECKAVRVEIATVRRDVKSFQAAELDFANGRAEIDNARAEISETKADAESQFGDVRKNLEDVRSRMDSKLQDLSEQQQQQTSKAERLVVDVEALRSKIANEKRFRGLLAQGHEDYSAQNSEDAAQQKELVAQLSEVLFEEQRERVSAAALVREQLEELNALAGSKQNGEDGSGGGLDGLRQRIMRLEEQLSGLLSPSLHKQMAEVEEEEDLRMDDTERFEIFTPGLGSQEHTQQDFHR